MSAPPDIPGSATQPAKHRFRLLFVALSTFCWFLAAMFLLGWLARIGESLYINLRFGVLRPGDVQFERHGLSWRLALSGLTVTAAIIFLVFSALNWWRNRWRRALVLTILAYGTGVVANLVMKTAV